MLKNKVVATFLSRNTLLGVVFLTGGALLVVEVIATRMLSPYFGNTIYTFSSVISTVLGALSLGYYVGGRYADKYPKHGIFYGIILLSGICILLLTAFSVSLLPSIAYALPLTTGPLILSVLMFLVPSFLLGLLSPYVIKLQQMTHDDRGIGSISGEVFFWSTLGSISGSLSAGFLLIPYCGITESMVGVSVLLVFIGSTGLFFYPLKCKRKTLSIACLLLLTITALSVIDVAPAQGAFLYVHDGVYERITVVDGMYENKPVRYLLQDRSLSSAQYPDSDELVFPYAHFYEFYKLTNPDPKRALVLGAGAYSIPQAYVQHEPNIEVDVVDIEDLEQVSTEYFRLQPSDRMHSYIGDGRRFLYDTPHAYDVIFVDAYSSLFALPSHMATQEFFELSKQKLDENGIFLGNFIGKISRQKRSVILSAMRTFRSVYPNSLFFHSPDGQNNIVFVGINSDTPLDPCTLQTDHDLFSQLCGLQIDPDRFELSGYPLLTDNYSPTAHLAGASLRIIHNMHSFSGEEAHALVKQQVRYRKQANVTEMRSALRKELKHLGWEIQEQSSGEHTNIIAQWRPDKQKRFVLSSHYKAFNAYDENDGASGTAVLLELARHISHNTPDFSLGIDIVLFDGYHHDPTGAQLFADRAEQFYNGRLPEIGIVLDRVCDRDQKFSIERFSLEAAHWHVKGFWKLADGMYPGIFRDIDAYRLMHNHIPLIEAGIPSFLVADPDAGETCSPKSLERLGNALIEFLGVL